MLMKHNEQFSALLHVCAKRGLRCRFSFTVQLEYIFADSDYRTPGLRETRSLRWIFTSLVDPLSPHFDAKRQKKTFGGGSVYLHQRQALLLKKTERPQHR